MASICRSKTIYPRSHTSTLEIAGKPLQSNLAGQNRPESPDTLALCAGPIWLRHRALLG